MARFQIPDFNERTAAARAAKQTALEGFQKRAAPDPEVVAAKLAATAAKEAAAAEKRAARKAAIEEEKAAKRAEAEARAAASNIPPPTEAELKAARDARYAARKARKG